ncbi:TPA: AraC family transcriptional regulator [Clostridioides difficile]|uniref:AraC family transcriptional regulator n=1 Tax=Clostridioides difficile TaxID=1496 RepID=UPI0010B91D84|nr:helix-turn-helix domain-containing protein [Clostridioides difficile]MCP8652538.1 helix-turn-helix domain-containing protein [Clostridioides difficile]MDM0194058.1 helix-turn-helix domain-containing protein [Clostridioides difficile]VIB64644.1 AraC family transcriptional regulator [Clostridioides difficile]HBE9530561.1 AraC family transcriptional regulator [Clostridioides difficile]HBF0047216.1 AraC family transcriptional regulator [Clostridioides difficile]
MLSVTRYSIKNVRLKPWVKFIWYFETKSNILLNNKLLPTDSIDIILNLSDVMEYKIENQDYTASNMHFNGIRDKHGFIIQHGNIRVIGISFYPFGLYPFLKIPISEFNRQIVDLEAVSQLFAKKLEESLNPTQSLEKIVLYLEEVLLSILEEDLISNKYVKLLNSFIYVNRYSNIKAFCDDTNINIKTLERICLKYTGYTPKILKRIYRFKMASNQLIYNYKDDELFDFIYENEYYDQAHFIKEFKKFSGTSPIKFIGENKTIKENIKYSYL